MNWIIFTFFGAFFQNLRSSLQKKLNKDLSLIASSYVRFVFALPFATILFFSYFQNFSIISVILSNPNFIIYTFFASVLQIMFTFSLLYLFRFFLAGGLGGGVPHLESTKNTIGPHRIFPNTPGAQPGQIRSIYIHPTIENPRKSTKSMKHYENMNFVKFDADDTIRSRMT